MKIVFTDAKKSCVQKYRKDFSRTSRYLRMCEMVVVVKAWKKLKLIGRKNTTFISVDDSMAQRLIQGRSYLGRPMVRGFESLERHGALMII